MANEKLILKVANDAVKPTRNFIDPLSFAITFDSFAILTTAAAPTRAIKAPANREIAVDMV